jgi:hypothetical protein
LFRNCGVLQIIIIIIVVAIILINHPSIDISIRGGGVKLLASIDISTRAPWITQNEQHFVAGKIPHELDAQKAGS